MSDIPHGAPRGPSSPGGPDDGPPQGPPRGPDDSWNQPGSGGPPSGPNQRPVWLPYAVGAMVLALIFGVFALSGRTPGTGDSTAAPSTTEAAPTEIFLESAASLGTNPFTADVERNAPSTIVPPVVAPPTEVPTTIAATTVVPTTAPGTTLARRVPATGVNTRTGNTPGLYGGTRNNSSCDRELMITFLMDHRDKAEAWAGVQGISVSQIPDYIRSLTPVILREDTRVTNHGFKFGRSTSNQSVLQAGTAVLVDYYGVPRARCKCGNPLTEPYETPQTYTGTPWSWWDPIDVVIYRPATIRIEIFILIAVDTGEAYARPTGSDGSTDFDAPPDWTDLVNPGDWTDLVNPGVPTTSPTTTPTTAVTTTVAPTTVAPPTTPAPQIIDITGLGSTTASSASNGFPGDLAVDGDITTSWFSDGRGGDDPFDDAELFTWTTPGQALISDIEIVGNGSNPKYSTGYGFASITIEVIDVNNGVVFSQTVPFPVTGSVTVQPGVVGAAIDVILNGHESPDCGGFAELYVRGAQIP